MLLLLSSLLLSLFLGCDAVPEDTAVPSDNGAYYVSEASSPDSGEDCSLNRDLCITAPQGQTFAGDGNPNSVPVRTVNGSRRTSPQTKSTFSTHPYLTPFFVPLSGIHSPERFLFSICRFRL